MKFLRTCIVASAAAFATQPSHALDAAAKDCLAPQKVLERMQELQNIIGGKTVMLTDGLQQSFADEWRREAHVAPVKVSSMVAHLFSDATGENWKADVVEFDAKGCAMSRTLVPGDIWNMLLKAAAGV
jgi:hypothetical protein